MFDANRAAAQFGVRREMPLAEAHSIVLSRYKLAVFPLEPLQNIQSLQQLALTAQGFTPVVSLEEGEHPETLCLDLSGTTALWTSESEQIAAIKRHFNALGYRTHIAVAPSLGAAWGISHYHRDAKDYVITNQDDEPNNSRLPVEALRLEQTDVSLLHRLGIKTIPQLLKLERSSLKRRLGARVCLRLSQFQGDIDELITPYKSPERFVSEFRCEFPLSHQPSIEHLLHDLLRKLLVMLSEKQAGLVSLAIELGCVDIQVIRLEIDLGFPTLEERLLWDLCQLKWEQLRLPSAVKSFRLEATQTQRLLQRQSSLISDEQTRASQSLQPLIAKLTARLGKQSVVRFHLTDDPLPESSVELIPAIESSESDSLSRTNLLERPLRLLFTGEAIDVIRLSEGGKPQRLLLRNESHDVTSAWGPERIESAWWRGPMQRRDYYRVETSLGHRWWIFQRLADRRWFLHGEWA